MFLTITGKLGSGKSTICRLIADKYDYRIYSTGEIQRRIALDMGISTLELNELMREDSKYDHLIDDEVVRISDEDKGEKIIFDSRMAFHFVKESYDIFVTIDPMEAARRVSLNPRGNEEKYVDQNEAKQKLLERSEVENIRFKEIYKVDNLDYHNYDLIIDTTWGEPEGLAEQVINCVQNNIKKILLSPKALYPTKALRDFNLELLNQYTEKMKNDSYEPIKILYSDNYHYVIDGHHRLLAALLSGKELLSAELIDLDEYPEYADKNHLLNEIKKIGSGVLSEYEAAGEFTYKSYPEIY